MPSSSLRRSRFQVIPYEDPIGRGGGCGSWEQQEQRGPTYTGEYDAHIESMTRKRDKAAVLGGARVEEGFGCRFPEKCPLELCCLRHNF